MSFLEAIFGEEAIPRRYKYSVIAGKGVRVEFVKCISSLSPSKVVISVKGGRLIVHGKDLFIKSYCYGDLVLDGEVFLIEEEGKVKND